MILFGHHTVGPNTAHESTSAGRALPPLPWRAPPTHPSLNQRLNLPLRAPPAPYASPAVPSPRSPTTVNSTKKGLWGEDHPDERASMAFLGFAACGEFAACGVCPREGRTGGRGLDDGLEDCRGDVLRWSGRRRQRSHLRCFRGRRHGEAVRRSWVEAGGRLRKIAGGLIFEGKRVTSDSRVGI